MRLSRSAITATTAALAIWALASCGGGGGGNVTTTPTKGSLTGKVVDTDSANGGGVAGVAVLLTESGSGTASTTTAANGQFTIGNLDPGAWTVQITSPANMLLATGETGQRSATVAASNTATTVSDFSLARTKGSLSGSVRNGAANVAAVAVNVSRAGFTTKSVTTDATGSFALSSLPTGPWTVSVSVPATLQLATGEAGTRSVTVAASQTTAISAFALEPRIQSSLIIVHITGSNFVPADVSVTAGTTVRWVNDAAAAHTITPQDLTQPGVFGRKTFSNQGTVLEHTFSTAGQVYHYRCEIHSDNFTVGMVGTVTVQ